MTNRLERICHTHNVLRGNNCSVLKASSGNFLYTDLQVSTAKNLCVSAPPSKVSTVYKSPKISDKHKILEDLYTAETFEGGADTRRICRSAFSGHLCLCNLLKISAVYKSQRTLLKWNFRGFVYCGDLWRCRYPKNGWVCILRVLVFAQTFENVEIPKEFAHMHSPGICFLRITRRTYKRKRNLYCFFII